MRGAIFGKPLSKIRGGINGSTEACQDENRSKVEPAWDEDGTRPFIDQQQS
jgi:hypothetical protein